MKTNWLDRPWTTRSYLKLMGISTAIGIGVFVIEVIWMFRDSIADCFEEKFSFKKKEPTMEEDP